jgi:hypothetical protein
MLFRAFRPPLRRDIGPTGRICDISSHLRSIQFRDPSLKEPLGEPAPKDTA